MWLDEAIPMLRILIWDFAEEPEFTDSRLKEVLVTSVRLVQYDLGTTDYTVSVKNQTVTPDILATEDDDGFLNLVILKSACLADMGQFRSRALLEGIRANCGPTGLAISGNLRGFETIIDKGPCLSYTELINQAVFSGTSVCKGIFSPFVSNAFDPRNLPRYPGAQSSFNPRNFIQ